MAALPRDEINRLIKVLGLLGSTYDGERVAAAERATAILKKHGATWSDVIDRSPPNDPNDEIDLDVIPDDGMDDATLCAYANAFLAGDEAGDFDLGDTSFIRDLVRANHWTARQRTGFVKSLRRGWVIRRKAGRR